MANEKLLKIARDAHAADNIVEAKAGYDAVRLDDPNNAEAEYFSAYYDMRMGVAVNGFDKVTTFYKTVMPFVSALADKVSEDEKLSLIKAIYSSLRDLPVYWHKLMWDHSNEIKGSQELLNKYNQERKACEKMCIELLYAYGDAIESFYSKNKELMVIAVFSWKSAIDSQQLYPYCGVEKTKPQKYVEKIKKIDPDYTLPKKAGCISFG